MAARTGYELQAARPVGRATPADRSMDSLSEQLGKGLPVAIELRKNCTYSLLVPTSMGVRLTPANGQPMHCSRTLAMQATSAETNVASVSSYLGLRVKVLTTFVKGSPIARFIKDDLASRHMDYEGKDVEQGGPWGYRHQFNLADSGCGSRGPRVHNDRAGEVGRTLNARDFDLDRIFAREGVQIVQEIHPFGETRAAMIADLDGLLLHLVEQP